ncbi:MAG: hypothetical protein DDT20_01795 [Firmicutes bacterium]|nr:hypothetical protein [Bacillota bacterium]
MSAVLQALRDANARLIEMNSVSVIVRRTEDVLASDGGRVKRETVLPPFAGRLVAKRAVVRVNQDEAGMTRQSSWALLAPATPVLLAGDAVFISGKHYTIINVVPRAWQAAVYAQHADVEEVH